MGVSAASDRGREWLVRGGLGGAISLCLEGAVWNLIDVTLTPLQIVPRAKVEEDGVRISVRGLGCVP